MGVWNSFMMLACYGQKHIPSNLITVPTEERKQLSLRRRFHPPESGDSIARRKRDVAAGKIFALRSEGMEKSINGGRIAADKIQQNNLKNFVKSA